jgi:hypothetical protein
MSGIDYALYDDVKDLSVLRSLISPSIKFLEGLLHTMTSIAASPSRSNSAAGRYRRVRLASLM